MEMTIPELKRDKKRKRAECTATCCTNQKIRVIIGFCNVADGIDIKVFSYDSPPIIILVMEVLHYYQSSPVSYDSPTQSVMILERALLCVSTLTSVREKLLLTNGH